MDHAQSASNFPGKQASRKKPKQGPLEEVIQTSFRLPRSRWKRLQELSIEERSSVQSIVVRALEAEFERCGLPF